MLTKEDHANAIAAHLPNGKTFEAKNIGGSNLRQLLLGIAGEFKISQDYITTLEQEYFPDQTVLYIDEWESALGIPDQCFSGTGTLEERRRDVVVKLASLGVQTANDFVELAAIFGKVVTVGSLANEVLPPYSVPFNPSSLTAARFVIVVAGEDLVTNVPPYDVPFNLEGNETVMECLFNRVAPSNCGVIFRNSN